MRKSLSEANELLKSAEESQIERSTDKNLLSGSVGIAEMSQDGSEVEIPTFANHVMLEVIEHLYIVLDHQIVKFLSLINLTEMNSQWDVVCARTYGT